MALAARAASGLGLRAGLSRRNAVVVRAEQKVWNSGSVLRERDGAGWQITTQPRPGGAPGGLAPGRSDAH
jgi:hypothetical protein